MRLTVNGSIVTTSLTRTSTYLVEPLPTGGNWAGAVTGTVSRIYDADFRLATESVNAASPVAFTYDPDSRGHPHRCLGHRGHGGEGGRSLAVTGGGRADKFRRSGAGPRGRCPRCPPWGAAG